MPRSFVGLLAVVASLAALAYAPSVSVGASKKGVYKAGPIPAAEVFGKSMRFRVSSDGSRLTGMRIVIPYACGDFSTGLVVREIARLAIDRDGFFDDLLTVQPTAADSLIKTPDVLSPQYLFVGGRFSPSGRLARVWVSSYFWWNRALIDRSGNVVAPTQDCVNERQLYIARRSS